MKHLEGDQRKDPIVGEILFKLGKMMCMVGGGCFVAIPIIAGLDVPLPFSPKQLMTMIPFGIFGGVALLIASVFTRPRG